MGEARPNGMQGVDLMAQTRLIRPRNAVEPAFSQALSLVSPLVSGI